MGTTAEKLQKILDTKSALKTAINAKGGTITDTTLFSDYATQVNNLPTPIEEIATTEDLDMADGNMVITPNEGQAFSSVTINKPDTMLPENIKKDINIGGVVGTLESGSATKQVSITCSDTFQYSVDGETQLITSSSSSLTLNVKACVIFYFGVAVTINTQTNCSLLSAVSTGAPYYVYFLSVTGDNAVLNISKNSSTGGAD